MTTTIEPNKSQVFRVASKSEHGEYYQVEKRGDKWFCNCPSYKECRHIRRIKNRLKGEIYGGL